MGNPEPVEVRIGAIAAHCTGCSATFFVRTEPKSRLRMSAALTCAACGRPTTYAALVSQAADEAVQRSRDMLAKMKKPA
jgi:hypothetical protein